MATPIWRDQIIDVPAIDNVIFVIYPGSDNTQPALYHGLAYKMQGEIYAHVKVNDICADYLTQNIGDLINAHVDILKTFSLYANNSKIQTWSQYLNWEYKDGTIDKTDLAINRPITGRIQEGMKIPLTSMHSYANTDTATLVTTNGDGTQTTAVSAVGVVSPFNLYFNVATGAKHVKAYLTTHAAAVVDYDVIPKCHRYALYYVNELGAVDVLVIEGRYRMADGYTRSTYKCTYDNRYTSPGEVNYLNDIQRTWELHTGWLTDAEAGRMGHLLGSPLVYLCDCDDNNALYPVIITNGDCPYKTHKDGMVSYGINVQLARDMIRR